MQQIVPYIYNTNIFHCPANKLQPVDLQSPFNYFNGARAAYVQATNFAAVNSKRIQYPACFVLSGDTVSGSFTNDVLEDADKDDYSQNCVGGEANGTPIENWQAHNKGQNILFDDGHAKWYIGYNASEMTFRYDSMHGWQ